MKLFAHSATAVAGRSAVKTKYTVQFGALAVMAVAALVPLPARAAEHSLAGIRIFASVHEVLARYGNPSQVITDPTQFSSTTTSSPSGPGGGRMGGIPGLPGSAGGPPPGMMGGPGGMMGGPYGRGGMPPGAPGTPMMGAPGGTEFGGPPRGMGGETPGGTDTTTSAANGEVMYVYQRSNGLTLDFLLSPNGRVIQITALGYKAASIKTERGITLGTPYSTIVGKYGYPESQQSSGGVLMVKYLQAQHAAFQLHSGKVVGITVAAVE